MINGKRRWAEVLVNPYQSGTWRCLAGCACLALTTGCATTRNYLVDPDAAARLTVVSATVQPEGAVEFAMPPPAGVAPHFAGGGTIEPSTLILRGLTARGDTVAVPLAQTGDLRVRDAGGLWDARAEALVAGALWQPQGRVTRIGLKSGESIAPRGDSLIDAARGTVAVARRGGDDVTIDFADIQYLQLRDDHPGLTALAILGGVGLIAATLVAISLSGLSGLN